MLDRGSQEDPVVLIVEGINREGVQMLGTDLNIDPRFFAEHLGPLNSHDFYDGKVPDLSSVSLGFGKQQHQDVIRPGGKLIGIHHSSTLPSKLPECWPRAGTDRVQNFGPTGSLMPRISFCQVSQHGCRLVCPKVGCFHQLIHIRRDHTGRPLFLNRIIGFPIS